MGHVNHKKRAQSEIEEEFIRAYCRDKHDIEVLALVDENEISEANFQKKARDKRLEFFKDIVNKYNSNKDFTSLIISLSLTSVIVLGFIVYLIIKKRRIKKA